MARDGKVRFHMFEVELHVTGGADMEGKAEYKSVNINRNSGFVCALYLSKGL